MRHIALLLTYTLLPYALFARQDSTEILARTASFDNAGHRIVAHFYDNSSIAKLYQSRSPLTKLDLRFDLRREEQARLEPLGSGKTEGGLRAESYLPLNDRSTAWGSARYVRGHRLGVRWNSTADYLLLYPYVLADSVGGSLTTEEYAFGGGYARRLGRIALAVEGNYRAGQEYRQVDPRPHNKTSDFTLRVGMGVCLGSYTAGVDLSGRFYSQDQSVKFYDPRGNNAEEFYMLGLGSVFARYSGLSGNNNYLVDYDAKGYGIAAHFMPLDNKGWYLRAAYDRFDTDQLFRQNNHIPVSLLATQQATTAVGYRNHRWSLRAYAVYELRKGTEMIADRNGQGQIVDKQQMYTSRVWQAGAKASVEWSRRQMHYTLLPALNWWHSSASHLYPWREMTLSQLHMSLRAGIERRGGLWRLKAVAGADVYLSPTAAIGLPDVRPSIGEHLATTAARLSEGAIAPLVSLRAERRLNHRTACFVEAMWEPRLYAHGSMAHIMTAACGILF